jgi:broad specificity phosphatase PhoE
MKLYFMRHGESTANLQNQFSNTEDRHPLTEPGVEQAITAGRCLIGKGIDQIYSSPVLRALQTAQILANILQVPLETTHALREWSVGIYEGSTDPLGWELHRQVQEDWFFRHKLESKMPGGESFQDIQERFVPFIDGLLGNSDGSKENVLLVGHGGLFIAMLPMVFRNVDYKLAFRKSIPFTATVEAESRPDGLYCTSWCGVKFGGK